MSLKKAWGKILPGIDDDSSIESSVKLIIADGHICELSCTMTCQRQWDPAVQKLANTIVDEKQARRAVNAFRNNLKSRDPESQLRVLTTLDNLFKKSKIDSNLHKVLAQTMVPEFVKIVKIKQDKRIRDKCLVLLDLWQEAYEGGEGRYSQFFKACKDLKNSNVEFPQRERTRPIGSDPGPSSGPALDSSKSILSDPVTIIGAMFPPPKITGSIPSKHVHTFCRVYPPALDYFQNASHDMNDLQFARSGKLQINQCQFRYVLDRFIQALSVTKIEIENFSPQQKANCHHICKQVWRISTDVKILLERFCGNQWVQAAFRSGDVTEHLRLLVIEMEMYTTLLSHSQLWIGPQKILDHTRELVLKQLWERNKRSWDELGERLLKEAKLDREALLTRLKEVKLDREALMTKLQGIDSRRQDSLVVEHLIKRLETELEPQEIGSSGIGYQAQLLQLDPTDLKRGGRVLGSGAYGKVCMTIWHGEYFAEKVFKRVGLNYDAFMNEVAIMARSSHPNILPLICYTTDDRECSILMELMDMDLFDYIEKMRHSKNLVRPFDDLEALDLMLQVAEGMCYLQKKRIVHRDLKSKNILVTCIKGRGESDNNRVHLKIADFGISKTKIRSYSYHQTPNTGTTLWMAPELFGSRDDEDLELKYAYKSDVYSYGVICYEILSGQYPFSDGPAVDQKELKRKIKHEHLRPILPKTCPSELGSLVQKCWRHEPTERPSFSEICDELRLVQCKLLFTGL